MDKAELRQRAEENIKRADWRYGEAVLILQLLDENEALQAELSNMKDEHGASSAFYKLTVAQRDAAWAEIDQLRARAEKAEKERDALREALVYIAAPIPSNDPVPYLQRLARAALAARETKA